MSFQKFELNHSMVALHTIYFLFRNGMVNMVKTYDEHGDHNGWKKYTGCINEEPEPEIAESYKLVDYVVQSLQDSVSNELETEVVIHDIERPRKGLETRSASFITKMADGSEKVFLVQIASEYVDPDGGTAVWLRWRLIGASFSYKGRTIQLFPGWLWSQEQREELPTFAKAHIVSHVNGSEVPSRK